MEYMYMNSKKMVLMIITVGEASVTSLVVGRLLRSVDKIFVASLVVDVTVDLKMDYMYMNSVCVSLNDMYTAMKVKSY